MKPKIFGIGELLWDLLPSGPRMGGAPANFACHASALGADAGIVSRVGGDSLGRNLISGLRDLRVSTAGIGLDTAYPTGTVEVQLGEDGQPHFLIHGEVAWDQIEARPADLMLMAEADAVCFGTLGQRSDASRNAIRRLVGETVPQALRVFDVNLRQCFFNGDLIHESLQMANVLKLSDSELPVIAQLLSVGGTVREQLEELVRRYDLNTVAYTRGSGGSVLCDGVTLHEHAGLPTNVRDTIGAGDSFTAAVTVGLLHRWSHEMISNAANEVASHVCSCVGAVPPMPRHIRNRFLRQSFSPVRTASAESIFPAEIAGDFASQASA